MNKNIVKFPCLPNFSGYFVESCCFSFNFFNTVSSSSSINCSSLMFSGSLIIFCLGLSIISGRFPSRFLNFFFSFLQFFLVLLTSCSLSPSLPISFTVCHANRDCLSSTEFQILLIWLRMYSNCSFWCVLVLSGLSEVSVC